VVPAAATLVVKCEPRGWLGLRTKGPAANLAIQEKKTRMPMQAQAMLPGVRPCRCVSNWAAALPPSPPNKISIDDSLPRPRPRWLAPLERPRPQAVESSATAVICQIDCRCPSPIHDDFPLTTMMVCWWAPASLVDVPDSIVVNVNYICIFMSIRIMVFVNHTMGEYVFSGTSKCH
jgi:hypothetical protein